MKVYAPSSKRMQFPEKRDNLSAESVKKVRIVDDSVKRIRELYKAQHNAALAGQQLGVVVNGTFHPLVFGDENVDEEEFNG